MILVFKLYLHVYIIQSILLIVVVKYETTYTNDINICFNKVYDDE